MTLFGDRPHIIVWHDGGCARGAAAVARLQRMDRRRAIRFMDVRFIDPRFSPAPVALLSALPAGEPALVAQQDGHMLAGTQALAAVWRALPKRSPLGLVARWPVMDRVLAQVWWRRLLSGQLAAH